MAREAGFGGGLLDGQVAVVTGAAQGIGAAIARALAEQGASVAVADINLDAARETAAGLSGRGLGVRLDVRDPDAVAEALTTVADKLGELTVLVNNAGVNRIGPSESLPRERWQEVIDVNLTGAFYCAQQAGARMLANRGGSIINIASISAHLGLPGRAAYAASKAGLVGFTRTLACEWAGRGVRVNAVEPGYVRTPMIAAAIEQGLLNDEGMLARIPAGRLARPEDIADAVVFLASPRAAYITGQRLVVDGGYLVYGAPAPASEIPAGSYSP